MASFIYRGLWHGALLMQLLFLANARLRDEQRSIEIANDQSLRARFLSPEEFQTSALDAARQPAGANSRGTRSGEWTFMQYSLYCSQLLYDSIHGIY